MSRPKVQIARAPDQQPDSHRDLTHGEGKRERRHRAGELRSRDRNDRSRHISETREELGDANPFWDEVGSNRERSPREEPKPTKMRRTQFQSSTIIPMRRSTALARMRSAVLEASPGTNTRFGTYSSANGAGRTASQYNEAEPPRQRLSYAGRSIPRREWRRIEAARVRGRHMMTLGVGAHRWESLDTRRGVRSRPLGIPYDQRSAQFQDPREHE